MIDYVVCEFMSVEQKTKCTEHLIKRNRKGRAGKVRVGREIRQSCYLR